MTSFLTRAVRRPAGAWPLIPLALAAALAAAYLPGCSRRSGEEAAGPVRVLFTGDVGGHIDPCG